VHFCTATTRQPCRFNGVLLHRRSQIPFSERSAILGFNQIVESYVDRQYKPAIYAVVMRKERWEELPYLHQRAFSRAAIQAGDLASSAVGAAAEAFKSSEILRGAQFAQWTDKDLETVISASLQTSRTFEGNDGQTLVRIAFAAAAAPTINQVTNRTKLPKAIVEVYFATDRMLAKGGVRDTLFSAKREVNTVSFGIADVELKEGRQLGDDLEESSEILNTTLINGVEVNNKMAKLGRSQTPIIVFIHGYNNSFSDAVRRGAAIKADIANNATVFSYTWPSDGNLLGYGYDASSAMTASQNFQSFMDKLTQNIPANRISIIAHSMGGRLLLAYLANLQNTVDVPAKFKFANLVFAASDVTQDLFQQKVLGPNNAPEKALAAFAKAVTVYSSEFDRALGLSRVIHGDKRLGLSKPNNIFLAPNITSIDASAIDPAKFYQKFTTATRHSYVFDKASGVADLSELFADIPPEARQWLTKANRQGKEYWLMKQ